VTIKLGHAKAWVPFILERGNFGYIHFRKTEAHRPVDQGHMGSGCSCPLASESAWRFQLIKESGTKGKSFRLFIC